MIAKRLFDVLASSVGLIMLLPVFVVIAIAIRLDSEGEVLFRQRRIGRSGRVFMINKFRTMRAASSVEGSGITIGRDPRITRVGRILRATKMDELPQLFNVLVGEMSLVGPRPELAEYVAAYPEDLRRRVLALRPGITDYASIRFRNESELLARATDPHRYYVESILPAKLRLNVAYAERAGLFVDLKIIFWTIASLFLPAPAMPDLEAPE